MKARAEISTGVTTGGPDGTERSMRFEVRMLYPTGASDQIVSFYLPAEEAFRVLTGGTVRTEVKITDRVADKERLIELLDRFTNSSGKSTERSIEQIVQGLSGPGGLRRTDVATELFDFLSE
jgi:hypothetical protein